MMYWIEYRKGSNPPVGLNKIGNFCNSQDMGARPFTAKKALVVLRNYHWATGLIPAKGIEVV